MTGCRGTRTPDCVVLHHDAVSGEEFVRKWTAILSAGKAKFRKDRAPTVNALRTLTGKDIPAPVAEKYLRRIYEATTEDDVTTLHELGLLEEVDPGLGTHAPRPIPDSDRATLDERIAEVRQVPKRGYHVVQRPRKKAKPTTRRQAAARPRPRVGTDLRTCVAGARRAGAATHAGPGRRTGDPSPGAAGDGPSGAPSRPPAWSRPTRQRPRPPRRR